jgi:signal transduction histidine kinase
MLSSTEERDHLRETLAELLGPAELAALSSPLIHAVNNFLNVVSLQLAVMARLVPEATGAELTSIRQHGKALAALIQEWLRSRSRSRPARGSADLNLLIEQGVEVLAGEGRAPGLPPLRVAKERERAPAGTGPVVRLCLAEGLPPVEGSPVDVLLLARFLVGDSLATLPRGTGTVTVTTAADTDRVLLRVEDSGPPVPLEVLPRLFDTSLTAREGSGRLELAACESLVRRQLLGTLHAANGAAGGLVIEARLRPAGRR